MKNKKIISLITAGVLLSLSLPQSQFLVANADENEPKAVADAVDQIVVDFVLSDTDFQGEIEYSHSPLYDEQLQIAGRQYDFTVGEVEGYALLAEIQGVYKTFYEIEEIFYEKSSPFSDCEGLPVYITHGVYLEYDNGNFYDILSGEQADETLVAAYAERGFGYCSTGCEYTPYQETVNYASKSTQEYSIQHDLPNYYSGIVVEDGQVAGCANAAGAILIGYYDRFKEGLIPNYQSYYQMGSIIQYKTTTTEVVDLIGDLYELMGTDVNHEGTTYEEFQDGMQQYVSGKGYTYQSTSIFSWSACDFDKYKLAVESNKPVAIFASAFTMVNNISGGPPTQTVNNSFCPVGHVMVGCGYKIDTFYNASGAVSQTRRYMKVASGLPSFGIGYLNVNGLTNVVHAISVNII